MMAPVIFQDQAVNRLDLTVAIPVRNGEKYLEETLFSVVNQTREPDRIVLFDNCSTDGTLDIWKAFAKRHLNLGIHFSLYSSEIPMSMVDNFNRALDLAEHTDALHIISHDDLVSSSFYQELLPPLAMSNGRGMAYSQLAFIDDKGSLIGTVKGRRDSCAVPLVTFLRRQSRFSHVYCQSVVLKTDRKPAPVKFQDMTQCADVLFFSEWATHCQDEVGQPNIFSIGLTLCKFRIHDQSASAKNGRSDAAVAEEWECMRRVACMIEEGQCRAIFRILFQRLLFACRCEVKGVWPSGLSPIWRVLSRPLAFVKSIVW